MPSENLSNRKSNVAASSSTPVRRPYKCTFCIKTFTVHSNLVKHTRTHTGERPFKCELCEKAFANPSNLTRHRRLHLGIRPYACRICHKGFRDSTNLKYHMKTHLNDISFACDQCSDTFSNFSAYCAHMKAHLDTPSESHDTHLDSRSGILTSKPSPPSSFSIFHSSNSLETTKISSPIPRDSEIRYDDDKSCDTLRNQGNKHFPSFSTKQKAPLKRESVVKNFGPILEPPTLSKDFHFGSVPQMNGENRVLSAVPILNEGPYREEPDIEILNEKTHFTNKGRESEFSRIRNPQRELSLESQWNQGFKNLYSNAVALEPSSRNNVEYVTDIPDEGSGILCSSEESALLSSLSSTGQRSSNIISKKDLHQDNSTVIFYPESLDEKPENEESNIFKELGISWNLKDKSEMTLSLGEDPGFEWNRKEHSGIQWIPRPNHSDVGLDEKSFEDLRKSQNFNFGSLDQANMIEDDPTCTLDELANKLTECGYCKRIFSLEDKMSQEFVNEKPYCGTCDRGLVDKAPPIKTESPDALWPKCLLCGTSFEKQEEFKEHVCYTELMKKETDFSLKSPKASALLSDDPLRSESLNDNMVVCFEDPSNGIKVFRPSSYESEDSGDDRLKEEQEKKCENIYGQSEEGLNQVEMIAIDRLRMELEKVRENDDNVNADDDDEVMIIEKYERGELICNTSERTLWSNREILPRHDGMSTFQNGDRLIQSGDAKDMDQTNENNEEFGLGESNLFCKYVTNDQPRTQRILVENRDKKYDKDGDKMKIGVKNYLQEEISEPYLEGIDNLQDQNLVIEDLVSESSTICPDVLDRVDNSKTSSWIKTKFQSTEDNNSVKPSSSLKKDSTKLNFVPKKNSFINFSVKKRRSRSVLNKNRKVLHVKLRKPVQTQLLPKKSDPAIGILQTSDLLQYKCRYCEKAFSIQGNLIKHVRVHTGERPYRCPYCAVAFANSSNLTRHIRTHTGEKPYKCLHCDRRFRASSNLRTHQRTHFRQPQYKCTSCEETFLYYNYYKLHLKTHQTLPKSRSAGIVFGRQQIKTDGCSNSLMFPKTKDFSFEEQMNNMPEIENVSFKSDDDKEETETVQTVISSLAPKNSLNFSNQSLRNVNQSEEEEEEEDNYLTSLISDSESTSLKARTKNNVIIINLENNSLDCYDPPNSDDVSASLSERQSIEHFSKNKVQPPDEFYEKRRSQSFLSLNRKKSNHFHLSTEPNLEGQKRLPKLKNQKKNPSSKSLNPCSLSKSRPYRCVYCSKGFTVHCNLVKHIRIHTGEKPFTCDKCGKAFANPSNLTRHLRTHTGERPYKCSLCSCSFQSSANLKIHAKKCRNSKEHVQRSSSNPTSKCPFCNQIFPRSKEFKHHLRVIHGADQNIRPDNVSKRKKILRPSTSMSNARRLLSASTIVNPNVLRLKNTFQSKHQFLIADRKLRSARQKQIKNFNRQSELSEHDDDEVDDDDDIDEVEMKTFQSAMISLNTEPDPHLGTPVFPDFSFPQKNMSIKKRFKSNANRVLDGVNSDKTPECRIGRLESFACEPILEIASSKLNNKDVSNRLSTNNQSHLQTSENPQSFAPRKNDFLNKFKNDKLVSRIGGKLLKRSNHPEKIETGNDLSLELSLSLQTSNAKSLTKNTLCTISEQNFNPDGMETLKTAQKHKFHKCRFCERMFPSRCNLTKHVRTHTGEKPFRCKYCRAAFANPSNLTRHVRTHTGEKPYSCPHCSKTFRASSNLKQHLHTHRAENAPYKCRQCNRTFFTYASFKLHLHHHCRFRRPSLKTLTEPRPSLSRLPSSFENSIQDEFSNISDGQDPTQVQMLGSGQSGKISSNVNPNTNSETTHFLNQNEKILSLFESSNPNLFSSVSNKDCSDYNSNLRPECPLSNEALFARQAENKQNYLQQIKRNKILDILKDGQGFLQSDSRYCFNEVPPSKFPDQERCNLLPSSPSPTSLSSAVEKYFPQHWPNLENQEIFNSEQNALHTGPISYQENLFLKETDITESKSQNKMLNNFNKNIKQLATSRAHSKDSSNEDFLKYAVSPGESHDFHYSDPVSYHDQNSKGNLLQDVSVVETSPQSINLGPLQLASSPSALTRKADIIVVPTFKRRQRKSIYKCVYCEKTFSVSSNLTKHVRTHTGEKPFHCRFCPKAFANPSNLIRHERIHTGERPYQCLFCSQTFAASGNLKEHIRKHTGSTLPTTMSTDDRLPSLYSQSPSKKIKEETPDHGKELSVSTPFDTNISVNNRNGSLNDDHFFLQTDTGSVSSKDFYSQSMEASIGKKIIIKEEKDEDITKAEDSLATENEFLSLFNQEISVNQLNPKINPKPTELSTLHSVICKKEFPMISTIPDADFADLSSLFSTNKEVPTIHRCQICDLGFEHYQEFLKHLETHSASLESNNPVTSNEGAFSKISTNSETNSQEMISEYSESGTPNKQSYLCKYGCQSFGSHLELRAHLELHEKQSIGNSIDSAQDNQTNSNLRNDLNSSDLQAEIREVIPFSISSAAASKINFHLSPMFNSAESGVDPNLNVEHGQSNRLLDEIFTSQPYQPGSFEDVTANWLKNKSSLKPHQCPFCVKSFSKRSQLTKHIRTHTGETPHKCRYCGTGFANPSNLTRHIRTHTGEKPYKCPVCKKAFGNSSNMKEHHKTHLKFPLFRCKTCQKKFTHFHLYKTHLKSHSKLSRNDETVANYEPPIPIVIDNNSNSSEVVEIHQPTETKFSLFSTKTHRNKGISVQTDTTLPSLSGNAKKNHKTGLKVSELKTDDSIYREMKGSSRTNENHHSLLDDDDDNRDEMSCDISKKKPSFPSVQLLSNNNKKNEHLINLVDYNEQLLLDNSVKNEKPKNFDSHLRERPKSHFESKKTKLKLKNKVANRPKTFGQNPSTSRSHICHYCGKSFNIHSHLTKHIRTHTGERPFKCHSCDAAFANSSNLTRHVRTHTGEKPYLCPHCSKTFRASSNLKVHLKMIHAQS